MLTHKHTYIINQGDSLPIWNWDHHFR